MSRFYHDFDDHYGCRYNRGPGARLTYFRPCMRNFSRTISDMAHPHIGKDGFQVCMDVHQFAPDEITVTTVNDVVVVDAKHDGHEDEHGLISRQFTRRYTLPTGYHANQVVSELSSDGVLTIKAPLPIKTLEGANVRVVSIQQTGLARLDSTRQKIDNAIGEDQK